MTSSTFSNAARTPDWTYAECMNGAPGAERLSFAGDGIEGFGRAFAGRGFSCRDAVQTRRENDAIAPRRFGSPRS
jgi:hypothetical protein